MDLLSSDISIKNIAWNFSFSIKDYLIWIYCRLVWDMCVHMGKLWVLFLRSYPLEDLFIFICMNVCFQVCMCTCVCLVPMEVKENIRFPGTRVTGGCAMLDRSWESNLVLLQEQQVFSPTGSSLHHVHLVV